MMKIILGEKIYEKIYSKNTLAQTWHQNLL
jgi:hypothetical protein